MKLKTKNNNKNQNKVKTSSNYLKRKKINIKKIISSKYKILILQAFYKKMEEKIINLLF